MTAIPVSCRRYACACTMTKLLLSPIHQPRITCPDVLQACLVVLYRCSRACPVLQSTATLLVHRCTAAMYGRAILLVHGRESLASCQDEHSRPSCGPCLHCRHAQDDPPLAELLRPGGRPAPVLLLLHTSSAVPHALVAMKGTAAVSPHAKANCRCSC